MQNFVLPGFVFETDKPLSYNKYHMREIADKTYKSFATELIKDDE